MLGIASAQAQPANPQAWSGFYVSGLAGATHTRSDTSASSPTGEANSYFTSTDFAQIREMGDGRLSDWEPTGGLRGGYNWQHGRMVLGIEAAADLLAHGDDRSETQRILSATTERFTLRQDVKADWMASLRPRLGWAGDRWMAYVSAGPAITRAKLKTTYSDDFNTLGTGGASGRSSDTETKIGATFGLGAEYALNRNWSLTAQYSYTDFGSIDTTLRTSHPDPGQGKSTIDSSADLRIHAALIGITYRFTAP